LQATGTLNWTKASCATGDAGLLHLFFSEQPSEIAEAKAICRSCPLRLPCLEGAIERGEPWGVWGGHLFDKGEIVAQKRRRGRPRKEDLAVREEFERELADELAIA
jgi:WhiB family redox-sensing transcriptional regulator